MRLPRDVSGEDFAKRLSKLGYAVTRQTGSHMRLTRNQDGAEYHLTIPAHQTLRLGTLHAILSDVSTQLNLDRETLVETLFK